MKKTVQPFDTTGGRILELLCHGRCTVSELATDLQLTHTAVRALCASLEQHGIIDLLPDREPATVEGWLEAHPEITVVSRDRGGGYGQAAAKAAPQAMGRPPPTMPLAPSMPMAKSAMCMDPPLPLQ